MDQNETEGVSTTRPIPLLKIWYISYVYIVNINWFRSATKLVNPSKFVLLKVRKFAIAHSSCSFWCSVSRSSSSWQNARKSPSWCSSPGQG